jgi:hypothetical protein
VINQHDVGIYRVETTHTSCGQPNSHAQYQYFLCKPHVTLDVPLHFHAGTYKVTTLHCRPTHNHSYTSLDDSRSALLCVHFSRKASPHFARELARSNHKFLPTITKTYKETCEYLACHIIDRTPLCQHAYRDDVTPLELC